MTGAELAIMALIVGVTAVLVSEPPAKAQAALEATQVPKGTATIITGPYHLELKVEPGTAGPNDIVIEVVHGDPPTEVKVSASLPDQQIGPLDYVAVKSGETEYTVKGADLSIAGTWTLNVNVRVGEFDAYEGEAQVGIK